MRDDIDVPPDCILSGEAFFSAFSGMASSCKVSTTQTVANTISKLDMLSMRVVDQYPAPGGPDCMDVSADGRYLYVTARWSRKLLVIDTAERRVVQSVKVGKSPHGVWTLRHAPR